MISILHLYKAQHLIIHKSTIFELMHEHNNVILDPTQAYWTYHNPIYFAFKLHNHIFQLIIPSIDEQTSNKK